MIKSKFMSEVLRNQCDNFPGGVANSFYTIAPSLTHTVHLSLYFLPLYLKFYILAAGDGNFPDVLQEAQIQVLELADCQERYSSTPYQVYDESICVFKLNSTDEHTGSCYVSIYISSCCRTRAQRTDSSSRGVGQVLSSSCLGEIDEGCGSPSLCKTSF